MREYIQKIHKNNTIITRASLHPGTKVYSCRIPDNQIKFNDSLCKNCDCIFEATPDGFFYQCTVCHARYPDDKKTLFSLPQKYRDFWINFGVVNNDNKIQAALTDYDVMKKYPLELALFDDNKLLKEKFEKIHCNHNIMDIVDFIYMPGYESCKNGKIYYLDEEINKTQLFTAFSDKCMDVFEAHIEYYTNNTDFPRINTVNENKCLLVSYNILKKFVSTTFELSMPFLIQKIKNDLYSPELTLNKSFFKKIVFSQDNRDHIRLADVFDEYTKWYSRVKCEEEFYTKKELREKISDHIKKNMMRDIPYKRYSIKNFTTFCWKNVVFDESISY